MVRICTLEAMIRLSRLTDYAITLLSYVGNEGDVLWTAPGLAEKSGLPMPTVAKILKVLAKSGLVTAQRGASGGYKLTKSPAHISVAEIIEAMDGPIAITKCAHGSLQKCAIKNFCAMSNGWNKINGAVRDALSDVSLAEMVDPSLASVAERKS